MDDPPLKIGMMPVAPGEFIREEILEKLALSVSGAEILGLRGATLSDFVNGYAALQPELALRIEKTFGLNMGTLLRMPGVARTLYDAAAGRRDGRATVTPVA